ncbi:MAG: hypothetical protein D6828_02975, partial [Nitrospirae bacterium]
MMRSRVTIKELPIKCLKWLISSRQRFLNDLKEGKPLRYFSAHLPVVSTWRKGEYPFPVNMTVKGIGLIPKEEHLQYYIDVFEGTIAQCRGMDWSSSLGKRIDAMNRLYSKEEHFDSTLLGGLEIFKGTASKNLLENPYASLLYVGMSHSHKGGIEYISFQVNGEVEILKKDNIYYRFLLSSRKLFEFDKFHIYQPD